MANKIVVFSDQLVATETTDVDESVVGIGDDALEIGAGNNVPTLGKRNLDLRDG
jgi:hypothetical protein